MEQRTAGAVVDPDIAARQGPFGVDQLRHLPSRGEPLGEPGNLLFDQFPAKPRGDPVHQRLGLMGAGGKRPG